MTRSVSGWSRRYFDVWMPNEPPPPSTAYRFPMEPLSSAVVSIAGRRGRPEVVLVRIRIQDRPIVAPGVARLGEERAPLLRPQERDGGEHPLHEDVALGLVPVRIDLDVPSPGRQPLDLAERGQAALALQVVEHVDRDHGREGARGKRQLVRGSPDEATRRLRLGAAQRVVGDVEPPDAEPGADGGQILDEKPLGAPDVQHAVARREAEVLDDVPRDGDPAPVVAIAPVALFPPAVEILGAEPERHLPVLGIIRARRVHLSRTARARPEQVDLRHHACSSISRWALASPASKDVNVNDGKALWSATTSKWRCVTRFCRGVPAISIGLSNWAAIFRARSA